MAAPMFLLIALLAIFAAILGSESFYLPKREPPRVVAIDPKKRPFCNAFTGCGRKRSDIPSRALPSADAEPLDESIGSILELSAEPAVEDISRQIMSEAKLWEAIQEANVELARARQRQRASAEPPSGGEGAAPPLPFVK